MAKFASVTLPLLLVLIPGCASTGNVTPKDTPVVTKSAGLAQQDLVAGECALFLWAASGTREFIYFQKQESATAKYYRNETTLNISTSDNTSNLADSPSLNLSYVGPAGEKITVTGGYGGEIEGGLKIVPATIKFESDDGWQQITPASGVFACL